MEVDVWRELHETRDAKWEAGWKTAERFEQVRRQCVLLTWLGTNASHLSGIEGVTYTVSVMKRFPQHERVQQKGCYALFYLCHHHPALTSEPGS